MKRLLLLLAVGIVGTVAAHADTLMPNFASVPTGWTTDRYAPTSFENVGGFQGRSDVLGIGIASAGAVANRPAGQQGAFYNTQGKQHAISGGAGSSISADLYIATEWIDGATNGNVRSDMWGVIADPTASPDPHQYPIIGFTNYGGGRYRVYDQDSANGWVDLAAPVVFGAWTAFSMEFTGTSYEFYLNGVDVYSDQTIHGGTGFSAVIMQAYNFGDPSITGANAVDYTAHWAGATAVPEPSSWLLLGSVALLVGRKIRKRVA